MKPRHFWLLLNAKNGHVAGKKPRGLTADEANHLLNWMDRVENGTAGT
jgi:hypothetical protein